MAKGEKLGKVIQGPFSRQEGRQSQEKIDMELTQALLPPLREFLAVKPLISRLERTMSMPSAWSHAWWQDHRFLLENVQNDCGEAVGALGPILANSKRRNASKEIKDTFTAAVGLLSRAEEAIKEALTHTSSLKVEDRENLQTIVESLSQDIPLIEKFVADHNGFKKS